MIAFATPFSFATAALSAVSAPVVRTRTMTTDVCRMAASANSREWDRVVNDLLVPWANGQVEIDDGLIAPSVTSVRVAVQVAHRLREQGAEPPTAVLPDGDGGIVFEQRLGLASVQIACLTDGDLEYTQYDKGGLVRHEYVPVTALA